MYEVIRLSYIKKLLFLFGDQSRLVPLLLISFLVGSIIDFIGIGFIGPFLALFLDPQSVMERYDFLEGFSPSTLVSYAGILLIIIFGLRLIASYLIFKFILGVSFNRQKDLRSELAVAFFTQDYSARLGRNSGYYQTAIVALCSQYTNTAIFLLKLISELITTLAIIVLLCFVDITILISLMLVLGLFLLFYFKFVTNSFKLLGEKKLVGLNIMNQTMSEIVKGLKEIKILGLGMLFAEKVKEGATITAETEKKLFLHSFLPRYFIEFVLVFTITFVILINLSDGKDITNLISSLGVFLVASLRLLPAALSIIQCLNTLTADQPAILQLYDEFKHQNSSDKDIEVNKENSPELYFNKANSSLSLQNISFKYPTSELDILKDINLTIVKGDFVGIQGESGSGKTTLVDIILGIYKPTSGMVLVNGSDIHKNLELWRSNIAYLPQDTFLIEGTIAENIALGKKINERNESEIINSLEKSLLMKHINNLPNGIHTQIGDSGLFLSGGQKQRLAIARAFYNDKSVFIFDESTSALDQNSADKIVNQINDLSNSGATILMISHNLSSLNNCNKIITIQENGIKIS